MHGAHNVNQRSLMGHGAFDSDTVLLGSTLREFDAVLSAFEVHGALLSSQFIRLLTDNLGLVYAIRN